MSQSLPSLNYYKHANIDKIRWDKCILESSNGLIYALSWYLDAVTQENWDALISSDFQYVMPIPLRKKMGITYLSMPVFTQQLGIFGPGEISGEIIRHFCRQIAANIKYTDYNLNYQNLNNDVQDFSVKERTNLILFIPEKRDELFRMFNENTIRNIKRCEKSSVSMSTGSIRSIISLFMKNRGRNIPEWDISVYNSLERLYNMCLMRNYGISLGAYNPKGEMISGAFILQWKDRATFIFSGNSEEGKETGALSGLIYKYLSEAPPNIKIFDFEGSDDPGLARFYGGFGAINSNYLNIKRNALPFFIKWLKK